MHLRTRADLAIQVWINLCSGVTVVARVVDAAA